MPDNRNEPTGQLPCIAVMYVGHLHTYRLATDADMHLFSCQETRIDQVHKHHIITIASVPWLHMTSLPSGACWFGNKDLTVKRSITIVIRLVRNPNNSIVREAVNVLTLDWVLNSQNCSRRSFSIITGIVYDHCIPTLTSTTHLHTHILVLAGYSLLMCMIGD